MNSIVQYKINFIKYYPNIDDYYLDIQFRDMINENKKQEKIYKEYIDKMSKLINNVLTIYFNTILFTINGYDYNKNINKIITTLPFVCLNINILYTTYK